MSSENNSPADMAAVILLIPSASAGLHGLAFSLLMLTPKQYIRETEAQIFWALFFFVNIQIWFFYWRIWPSIKRGEMTLGGGLLGSLFVGGLIFGCAFMPGLIILYGADSGTKPSAFWVAGLGLVGLFMASQSLRQSWWFKRTFRTAENMPTARLRSAAMGPVEVAGQVFPLSAAEPTIWKSDYDTGSYHIRPFLLTDDTGSVLVEPPLDANPSNDEDLLWMPFRDGKPSLIAGDPVRVVGRYQMTGRQPSLVPWKAPGGRLPLAWSVFGKPHVFVIAALDEAGLHRHLDSKSRAWLILSWLWFYGATVVTVLGVGGIIHPAWMDGLLGR